MTRSQRLKPVVRISETHEQELARRLARARSQWQVQLKRLEELEGHQRQYESALGREVAHGVNAERLRQYRQFLERLADVVARQRQRVAELERACQDCRAAWLAARQRRHSLEQLAQRYARAERQAEAQREQRESDERAQHPRRDHTAS